MRQFVLTLFCCLLSFAATGYQSGKLVDVSDSNSNRVIGNAGSVQTVVDVEYRLSVELGEMVYVGSYWPRWRWSYAPTDFIVNDPVEVRIDGDHMYIKRVNSKELKTKIIQRIRRTDPPPR